MYAKIAICGSAWVRDHDGKPSACLGEVRVFLHEAGYYLRSPLAASVDIGPADPFTTIAARCTIFRYYKDLLVLVRLS